MLGKLGKAALALLTDPVFVTCGVVAVVTALSYFRGKKTLSKGMKATLITLFSLSSALALLLAVIVFAAIFTVSMS